MEAALIYARLTLLIALVALLITALRVKACNVQPLISSLVIYFGVSVVNQTLARFDETVAVSRWVITYAGTPLIAVVIVGLVATIRKDFIK